MLTEKVSLVATGNYPAEHLIVFFSLVLQRDRKVKKVTYISRVLERCMKMWRNEDFDLLLQEAIRCDRLLKNTQKFDTDGRYITCIRRIYLLWGSPTT